jgi:ribosomal protein L20
MAGLKASDVQLNRKVLADIAVFDQDGFAQLVDMVNTKEH